MMPDSGDEHDCESSPQQQLLQHEQQDTQQGPSKQVLAQQPKPLPQQLQVATHPQPQPQQYIPHISDASQQHKTLHTAQQQQQTEQWLLGDQQQQHERQQQRQQQHEAELQSADVKLQAAEALNTAFCRYIYSAALQYLQQQSSSEDLEQQFLDILDRDDPFDQPCTVAHQDINSSKNRYRDVVPYDHNRVCLPPPPPPAAAAQQAPGAAGSSSQSVATAAAASAAAATSASIAALGFGPAPTNYINASFMSDPQLTGDHAALQGYIATQGPLPATVIDFWRMVAATNTSAIVMLTGLIDGSPKLGFSKPRCAAYFPEHEQDVLKLPGAKVTCVHKNSLDENVHFRQLEVVWSEPAAAATAGGPAAAQAPQGGKAAAAAAGPAQASVGSAAPSSSTQLQQLWINHYEYAGWPDYGVPPTTASVLALCHALDGCRRAGCKIVVHCSAGVGRTGTFLAIDILLQRLHSLSLQLHGSVGLQDVIAAMNVPELVVNLRQQRRCMVQTWEQYSFIWQAVINELQALLQQQQQQKGSQQQQQGLPQPQEQQEPQQEASVPGT
jgi:tyrosine-protein phosphatase non-receptor type 9